MKRESPHSLSLPRSTKKSGRPVTEAPQEKKKGEKRPFSSVDIDIYTVAICRLCEKKSLLSLYAGRRETGELVCFLSIPKA